MQKVNLKQKLSAFNEHWSPKIVGQVNDFHVKLVKFQGEFVWHRHDDEDEMFLVLSGTFRMRYRDGGEEREITIAEGEFIIVPHGVEHQPVAGDEVHVLLFEPATTRNTGNVTNQLTVEDPERL